MQTPWDYRYAQRTQKMASSAIRELLKITEAPDIISFRWRPSVRRVNACYEILDRKRYSTALPRDICPCVK